MKLILPIFYAAILAGALMILTIRPVPDPDVWFHLALGREVLQSGAIPKADLYSYTSPGGEWISSGWGASVALEWAWRRGGAAGLVWLTYGIAAIAYLLVYFTCTMRYGGAGILSLLLTGAMFCGYLRLTPRPELWSQLFLALLLMLLISSAEYSICHKGKTPMWLWLLPLLMTIWANLHAGFMVAYVIIIIYTIWRICNFHKLQEYEYSEFKAFDWRFWAPVLISGLSWLINPYGWRLLALGPKIKSMPHVKERIMEWMPLWAVSEPNLPGPAYWGFAIFLCFAIAIWAMTRPFSAWQNMPKHKTKSAKGAASTTEIKCGGSGQNELMDEIRRTVWLRLAFGLFLVAMAFLQRRHAGLMAIGICIISAPQAALFEARIGEFRKILPAAAAMILFIFGIMQYNGNLQVGRGFLRTGVQGGLLPAYAVQYLQSNPPPPHMFNSYGAGGYLLYFLSPEQKVFIDGRLDVYDPKVWLNYMAIEDGQMSVEEAASKYQLNSFVIFSKDAARNPGHLCWRLAESPDWGLVYFDDAYAIFTRKSGECLEYTREREIRWANPFAPRRFIEAIKNPALRESALGELENVQSLSHNSANAMAFASLASRARGDENAFRLLCQALERDPNSWLAREIMEGRLP